MQLFLFFLKFTLDLNNYDIIGGITRTDLCFLSMGLSLWEIVLGRFVQAIYPVVCEGNVIMVYLVKDQILQRYI